MVSIKKQKGKALTVEVKGVGMFRTRVATVVEEVEHFLWRATEHQLSVSQDGNFVKVLIGQEMALACAQITISVWEMHFQVAG